VLAIRSALLPRDLVEAQVTTYSSAASTDTDKEGAL
jgi:hypothetical protein